MSGLIITALVILVFIVIYQISKAGELAMALRGEKEAEAKTNKLMAWLMVITFILGLWGIWECHVYLMPMMLPESASEHGDNYDLMLKITLIMTLIVFFATHILLFWFTFKYQSTETRKAFFYPHNNKLEVLWTTIPALALLTLVIFGLKNWFNMMGEAPKDSLVVEIVGKQFNWIIRYPGEDGIMGRRDFRLINDATNVLGLDWNDPASKDDIIIENGEMHAIKGRPVHLIINSRDVIHNVGLPHFRMKMDAVPGVTTTIWFTPKFTSNEMKKMTENEDFVYEIACDQMCGNGHYSMRGTIIVQTPIDYQNWIKEMKPYYVMQQEAAAGGPSPAAEAAPEADSATAEAVTAGVLP